MLPLRPPAQHLAPPASRAAAAPRRTDTAAPRPRSSKQALLLLPHPWALPKQPSLPPSLPGWQQWQQLLGPPAATGSAAAQRQAGRQRARKAPRSVENRCARPCEHQAHACSSRSSLLLPQQLLVLAVLARTATAAQQQQRVPAASAARSRKGRQRLAALLALLAAAGPQAVARAVRQARLNRASTACWHRQHWPSFG